MDRSAMFRQYSPTTSDGDWKLACARSPLAKYYSCLPKALQATIWWHYQRRANGDPGERGRVQLWWSRI